MLLLGQERLNKKENVFFAPLPRAIAPFVALGDNVQNVLGRMFTHE